MKLPIHQQYDQRTTNYAHAEVKSSATPLAVKPDEIGRSTHRPIAVVVVVVAPSSLCCDSLRKQSCHERKHSLRPGSMLVCVCMCVCVCEGVRESRKGVAKVTLS